MAWKYKTNAAQQHQKAAESGNQFKPVVCKKRMYGKPCNECQQIARLRQSDDEDDKAIANKCQAKSTYYMNVVDLKGKKTNQILPSGIGNWKDLIANLPDADGDGVDFTDPDAAYPVLLVRKGKGRNTRYTLTISKKSMQIPIKYLKGMYKLNNILDIFAENESEVKFVPEDGKNKFLVLPPWGPEANGDFFYEVFYHWNTDLLGAVSDEEMAEDFGDDVSEFGDDDLDETFSDDFDDGSGLPTTTIEKSKLIDELADDDLDETFSDDFDEKDDNIQDKSENLSARDLNEMDLVGLIDFCKTNGIKLSDKAKSAPLDKLLPYVKKKAADISW